MKSKVTKKRKTRVVSRLEKKVMQLESDLIRSDRRRRELELESHEYIKTVKPFVQAKASYDAYKAKFHILETIHRMNIKELEYFDATGHKEIPVFSFLKKYREQILELNR